MSAEIEDETRLPNTLVLKNDLYWFKCRLLRKMIPLGASRNEARINYAKYKEGEFGPLKRKALLEDRAKAKKRSTDRVAKAIIASYRSMQSRCRKAGQPFLSMDELRTITARAGGKCEVSGIHFTFAIVPGCHKRPWKPSIDRIDCTKGYTLENCRLVCIAVNFAMNQWGEETLRRIAKSMHKNRKIDYSIKPRKREPKWDDQPHAAR